MAADYIDFSDEELAALKVPMVSFAGFLASICGKMAVGERMFEPRPCHCEDDELTAFI